MRRGERIALYDWVDENKNKSGKEKIVTCTQMDYQTIRAQLAKRPYADYEIVENNRDTKTLRVFIL